MKIQIAPKKKVEDALVVWHEQLPEVDIVMDARTYKGLQMKAESLKAIYAFDILGLAEPKQIFSIVQNFFDLLQPGGELYVIETDFEYLNRAFVGGDLPLAQFNQDFRRSTYLNQAEIVRILDKVGFPEKEQRAWFDNLKFKKAHYELVVSGKKPNRQQ